MIKLYFIGESLKNLCRFEGVRQIYENVYILIMGS
jgi:hypothetical protein